MVKNDFELLIFLPQSPKCRDDKLCTPCSTPQNAFEFYTVSKTYLHEHWEGGWAVLPHHGLALLQGICNSHLVLEEPSSIVQLDYSQKVLLVSTLQRSLLFYTEEKAVKQIGSQPRKR